MRLVFILLAVLTMSISCEARKSRHLRHYHQNSSSRLHRRHLRFKWSLENPQNHHRIRHTGDSILTQDALNLPVVSTSFAPNGLKFKDKHIFWPIKREAVVEGDLVLGGLMMVHEREDTYNCGPIMPQGGVQALEAMLYTLDTFNAANVIPDVKIGAHILDDCDKDTYGLEMAVDFIKGKLMLLKI